MNQAARLRPTRHKLDVTAFYRMAEIGIIGERDRIELVDGDLIDMAPIGDKHIDVVEILTEQLVLASHGRAVTSVQNPLRLDQQNQPQPDLTLYRRSADHGTRRSAADSLLVIEVADSSLSYDTSTKTRLYARFGIPEYWVVDVAGKRVLVHRQPSPAGYRDVRILTAPTRLALAADAAIEVDFGLSLLFV